MGLRGRGRQGKGWGRLLPDRERQDRGSDDPLHGGAKIALESFGRRAHLCEAQRISMRRHCLSSRRGDSLVVGCNGCVLFALCFYPHSLGKPTLLGGPVHTMRSVLI